MCVSDRKIICVRNGNNKNVSYCLGPQKCRHQKQKHLRHERNNNPNIYEQMNVRLFVSPENSFPTIKTFYLMSLMIFCFPLSSHTTLTAESETEHVHRSDEWETDAVFGDLSRGPFVSCLGTLQHWTQIKV